MRSFKNAGIALTLTILYLFASTTLAAPERRYDVQVIVFSHITPQTVQAQEWPAVSSSAQITAPSEPTSPAFALAHERKMLERNPTYKILLDRHWQEAWHGENGTITIPLVGRNNQSQLQGTMTITLGHYFDVDTKLMLTEPTAALQRFATNGFFSHWNQPTFNFQLSENRRMRSNELNYINHPLMGVLIKIIPIK
ncbi:MAG: hypothetical protein A3F13_03570 [Gammaproteobacteria bacterium RIFCSPHIGHO2_12_FULL_40_19]|nr:MAG: hypothetical protein A3F13_03570 [Gammaproteobacteria bacterium RIFCSPHIGHO2_12_FULL_40_19]